jgi:hypothetical protein
VRALDKTGNVDNVEVSRDARRRLVVVAQKVKALIGHRNTRLVWRCKTRRERERERGEARREARRERGKARRGEASTQCLVNENAPTVQNGKFSAGAALSVRTLNVVDLL